MRQHILHILGTAQPEGAGIVGIVAALAGALDEKYTLHALFLRDGGPLIGKLERAGVVTNVVQWIGGSRDLIGACRFWNSLRHAKYSIIHQHFGGRSARSLAYLVTGGRRLVHLHGRAAESPCPIVGPIRIEGTDAVVAVSKAIADCVVNTRAEVIYPGVLVPDIDRPLPRRSCRTLVIGAASRLVPIKGLSYLLRAVAALRADHSEICLEIAGSGSEQQALETEAQSLGLTSCVKFLGWRDELDAVMVGWDIFVQPSMEEGFGISALQAMAAGIPVVATTVGGVPELVVDGSTGYLVPPRDSAALAGCLRSLLLNSERRYAMGAAGRVRARTYFSVERMATAISRTYDQLLLQ